ncbi:MAG: sigma-70 family RNA polymerase sigma factor [Chloroflexota bacterium]
MPATDTDSRLLQRLTRGDSAAFECIFLRHYQSVYRVAYGLSGRRDVTEDIVQETFLELYRQPPALREEGSLLSWLCRVALNKCHNSLRSERRAQEREGLVYVDALEPDYNPEDLLLKSEENARVRDALAQLTERQRSILLLRYAGLSYAEVAALAEIAPGSVGTMLVRAERAFMAAYKKNSQPDSQPDVYPLERAKQ